MKSMNYYNKPQYLFTFIILFLLISMILIYKYVPSNTTLPPSSNDILTNFTNSYCSNHYDAILVLAGGTGINPNTPPLWTQRRCKLAVEIYNCIPKRKEGHVKYPVILPLSAGTAHGAQPLDERGFPIYESAVMARYMHINYHIKPDHIMIEATSFDTIGNAFFARVSHVDLNNWRKLLVITSAYHMPRSKSIFEWVFKLPDYNNIKPNYELDYIDVPDIGLDQTMIDLRIARETKSLKKFEMLKLRIKNLRELYNWMMTEHELYAPLKTLYKQRETIDEKTKRSYVSSN